MRKQILVHFDDAYVRYYSTYENVDKLAEEIKRKGLHLLKGWTQIMAGS